MLAAFIGQSSTELESLYRQGYSIPMPSNLFPLPWQGEAQSAWRIRTKTFASIDGNVTLQISTQWTVDRTLQDFFNANETQETEKVVTGANIRAMPRMARSKRPIPTLTTT